MRFWVAHVMIGCSSCGTACSPGRAIYCTPQYLNRRLQNLNRKTAWLFLFGSLLLTSLTIGSDTVNADSSDSISFSSGITIYSPTNRTYTSKNLALNLTLACGLGLDYSLSYSLDGKYQGTLSLVIDDSELHVVMKGTALATLPELQDGSHILTIHLIAVANQKTLTYNNSVNFYVDVSSPNIVIQSPENKTYTTENTALTFTMDKQVSEITYCLDGQENVSIAGNTTLTGLSIGVHNITIQAQDFAENRAASKTIYFAIAEEPEPESLITVPVAVFSGALVVVAGISLLFYFKKHKHASETLK